MTDQERIQAMEDFAGYVLSRRIDAHISGDAEMVVYEARRPMFMEVSTPVLHRMHELSRMMMSHLFGGIAVND
jgi:hypothetical protein